MKVLYITNLTTPYRIDFFNELGKLCELTVLVESVAVEHRNQDWLSRVKATNFKIYCLPGFYKGKEIRLNYGLTSWLKRNQYDVVVLGGYSTLTAMVAAMIMRLRRIPYILNADGGFIGEEGTAKKKIKSFFISAASHWLSSGSITNDYLQHYGADPKKISDYPFTSVKRNDLFDTPTNKLEKQQIRQKLGITSHFLAISVGRFIYSKGFDVLIKAWAKADLPENAGLYIIGEGQEEEALRKLVDEQKLLNVKLVGFMHKEELEDYYRAADLFVLPTRGDIWGLVINEAMACGLPIISTDRCVSALELVCENENGYIVPVDDVDALADKLTLISSYSEAQQIQLGRKSLEKIEPYTIENMATIHLKCFREVLKPSANSEGH